MFSLFNVICYDGVDAFVIKCILEAETAKADIKAEFTDVGLEVLKVDNLYTVNLDTIFAWKNNGNDNEKTMVERFEKMYFT